MWKICVPRLLCRTRFGTVQHSAILNIDDFLISDDVYEYKITCQSEDHPSFYTFSAASLGAYVQPGPLRTTSTRDSRGYVPFSGFPRQTFLFSVPLRVLVRVRLQEYVGFRIIFLP